jgi:hypothetical protein
LLPEQPLAIIRTLIVWQHKGHREGQEMLPKIDVRRERNAGEPIVKNCNGLFDSRGKITQSLIVSGSQWHKLIHRFPTVAAIPSRLKFPCWFVFLPDPRIGFTTGERSKNEPAQLS